MLVHQILGDKYLIYQVQDVLDTFNRGSWIDDHTWFDPCQTNFLKGPMDVWSRFDVNANDICPGTRKLFDMLLRIGNHQVTVKH